MAHRALTILSAAVVTCCGLDAAAAERSVAVIVASDRAGGKADLRYASREALEMKAVLETLGGVTSTALVLNQEASELRSALARIRREADLETTLFFYYSGHADERGLLMGPTRLSFAELRRTLEDLPAKVRVVVIDACRSGMILRRKGEPVPIDVHIDDRGGVRGSVYLTATGADDGASESDALGGSVFSAALLTGLRGAADRSGDGRVTLEEAYLFAYERTLEHSTIQIPDADLDIRGPGALVLTTLVRGRSVLVFSADIGGEIVVAPAAGHGIPGRFRKSFGRLVRVAVDPGPYRVSVEGEERCTSRVFEVPAGGDRMVEARGMVVVPCGGDRAKGGGRAWVVGLHYELGRGYLESWTHGLLAGLRIPLGPIDLTPALGMGIGTVSRADELRVSLLEARAGLAVGREIVGSDLLGLRLEGEVEARWIRESATGSAEIARVASGGAGVVALGAGVELALPGSLLADLGIRGGAIAYRAESGLALAPLMAVVAGLGYAAF